AVGFFAGAIGISGGAFKVPLMVLLCGVPMEIAVWTSSAMVATTALKGFAGHMVHGSFDPAFALPLVAMAIAGGFIGSKCAIKSRPRNLKKIFAATNLLAAVIMAVNMMS
ncbi:MAG: sulfite exporter TauE/SafE family protein, partial [Clostridiales bacterium]